MPPTSHDEAAEGRTMGAIGTAVVAIVALVLAGGALVVAAGAGGSSVAPAATASADSDATTTAAPAELLVELDEFSISPGDLQLAVGGDLVVVNRGNIAHDLKVRDTDLATPMLNSGEEATLSLAGLEPGTYEVYCTVAGHDASGMVGTLTIVEGDGEPAIESADGGHGDHGADTDWAALDQAMHDTIMSFPAATEGLGNQPLEPEEILADGTKVFRLVAEIFEWELEPGNFVEGWGYNGQIPGPMIQVDVGDNVRVIVENELPMGTDVHWHGVRVPNDQDGVAPLTQPLIEPGETFVYEFEATEPAIGMYHPHHHGQKKLPNGMFGVFTIGQVGTDIPLPAGTFGGKEVPDDIEIVREIPMVLNDAGNIGLSLNGKSFPATEPYVVDEGDWFVIHYYNEGLQVHPMHLHQLPQLVFAKDGFPLDAPQWEDTVNVAPGERYSVLVQATDPGAWVLHCHILTHAERDTGMFGMVTAVIVEPAEDA
ncbi:MAG: multicopper oxidase domain-containing protein [Nitriliruptoraceae bacterium]|nr:multicopper oxidase domain-containing protein [Nitriliruptoraceae bacterium]